ncbi:MAG: hypothetical protein JWN32_2236 [Solirubrobacterales bacterium]|jgi:hypothetical protein|nr:hypothetical protein [Solirubrobacterales bacterium]
MRALEDAQDPHVALRALRPHVLAELPRSYTEALF